MNGITLIALALAAQATAGGEVAVEARVAADTVTVGDRFTLTITVSGLSDGQVDFPILPDSGLITAVSGPELVEGRRPGAWSARYALAAWDTGTVDLPGARVEISSGDDRSELPVPGVSVYVRSVLPADADPDTLALRPALEVIGSDWTVAELVAMAGGLVLLLALLLYLLARRSARGPVPAPTPVPPRQRALDSLDALGRSGLVEGGELKAFYSRLSATLRRFIADSEDGWGLELTTRELVAAVAADGLGDSAVGSLTDLLVEADLVKFAGRRPAAERAERALAAARAWVLDFQRPRPPVVPETGAGGGADEEMSADADASADAVADGGSDPGGGAGTGESRPAGEVER